MSHNLQRQPKKLEQKVIARVIFYEKYLRFICNYGVRYNLKPNIGWHSVSVWISLALNNFITKPVN